MQALDRSTPRRYRRGAYFAAVLILLTLIGAGLLTWANAAFSRFTLRQQLTDLQSALPLGWSLMIDELSGGFAQTQLQLTLLSPLHAHESLRLRGDLQHYLLTIQIKATLSATTSAHTFATLSGAYRVDAPAMSGRWNALIEGEAFDGQIGELACSLEPWNAEIEGDQQGNGRLWLNIQGLEVRSGNLQGSLSDWQLALTRRAENGEATARNVQMALNLNRLDIRSRQASTQLSGALLQAQLDTSGLSWPFDLTLDIDELLNKGLPFTRLYELRYQLGGVLTMAASRSPPARSASTWRSRHQFDSASNYGPLHLMAQIEGSDAALTGWRIEHSKLDGELPLSLWSLAQRIYPAAVDALMRQAQTREEGSQFFFSATLGDARQDAASETPR